MDMVLFTSDWRKAVTQLLPAVREQLQVNEPLSLHTTLRVGGPADFFYVADNREFLVHTIQAAHELHLPFCLLGEGSNVCVSDRGVRGLVIINRCRALNIGTTTTVDAGYNFMKLVVMSMEASLSGLEWGVGIPGAVGGALVSNAGAYRGNIGPIVRSLEVVEEGIRKQVGPTWMEFSYRDSRLRRKSGDRSVIVSAQLELKPDSKKSIRDRARDYQRQRILKQPWLPSAGSFFKNIEGNFSLANSLPGLPEPMRKMGRIPAAYLSEMCCCKGLTAGGAAVSRRHANFIVNRGGASAENVRELAGIVKKMVLEKFGVLLEEEVLYIGEW